jgi:hypothetical protein
MAKRKTITVTTGSKFTWPDKLYGRKITFKIQPIKNGIAISRGGRRGGFRAEGKKSGGLLVCQMSHHERPTHCIRETSVVIFPGGGAQTRKWSGNVQLHGYSKKNRRVRRTRRAGKRKG